MMLCLSYGVSRGLDPDELCAASGVEARELSDPLRMMPYQHTERMWRTLIERLPDENVAVGLGMLVRPEHYGFLFQAAPHLSCGLELLQLMARLLPQTDTACIAEPVLVSLRGELVELRWPASLKLGMPERMETLSIALLSLLRAHLGCGFTPRCVLAAHRESPKRLAAAELYGCEVRWDSGYDALCFDRAQMLAAWPNAAPKVAAALLALVEQKVAPPAALSFREAVRREIERRLPHGEATQARVARALGLSVRSLQRRLERLGWSYGQALASALQDTGDPLLRASSNLSLADIAHRLGYSDLSSFSRAWKRLTGESPSRYRTRVAERSLEPKPG
jgi:AraC-like DNA-binding protein